MIYFLCFPLYEEFCSKDIKRISTICT